MDYHHYYWAIVASVAKALHSYLVKCDFEINWRTMVNQQTVNNK